jgi:hemolysin activation/secretion protein
MNTKINKITTALAGLLLIVNAQADVATTKVNNVDALLNYYKQDLDSLTKATDDEFDKNVYEEFNGFAFKGLAQKDSERANELVAPYLTKKIVIGRLIAELERDFQDHGNPLVFILTRVDKKLVLTATKVNFGHVLVNNTSNLSTSLLQDTLANGISEGKPLNRPQLEHNSSVLNEVPGVINQYGMKPGSKPGETDLSVTTTDAPWYNGSMSVDNSSQNVLGMYSGRGNLSLVNLLGRGDVFKVYGLGTENSYMIGGDVSALVTPSGLRAGASYTRFAYDYTNAVQYTGDSTDIGAYLTYPLTRSEYYRQSLTLNYDHVETRSNFFNTQSFLPLANYTIDKASLGTYGVTSLPFEIVSSYQVAVLGGNATENTADIAEMDALGLNSMGAFGKLTGTGTLTKTVNIVDTLFNVSLSGSAQAAFKNLPGTEKAYLGGMYQMKAWSAQAMSADHMAYGQFQIDKEIIRHLTIGPFIELAYAQQNVNAYQGTVGTVGQNSNFMSDVGLNINYVAYKSLTFTGNVAHKITGDPTLNNTTIQDDSYIRGWLGVSMGF